MDKAKQRSAKKRITREEAKRLYPDEWVVFQDAHINEENTTFIDGVVFWHGKSQKEAHHRSASIERNACRAGFCAGYIPYRQVTLSEDHSENRADRKKVA